MQHINSSQMVRNDLAVSCSKRFPSQTLLSLSLFYIWISGQGKSRDCSAPSDDSNQSMWRGTSNIAQLLFRDRSAVRTIPPPPPPPPPPSGSTQIKQNQQKTKAMNASFSFSQKMFYGTLPFSSTGCFGCWAKAQESKIMSFASEYMRKFSWFAYVFV